MNGLRKGGWLDYARLSKYILADPAKLEADLREALKSYRFPNRAVKAILVNLEKIEKEYQGNLHNIYSSAKEQFGEDSEKVTLEVWKRVNDMYWYGTKKAGVFVRELITQGLWDLPLELIPIPPDSRVRRVMFRLGLVKDRNDFKEIETAAKQLAKKAKITPLELDCTLWTLGAESLCGERKKHCERCPLDFYCLV